MLCERCGRQFNIFAGWVGYYCPDCTEKSFVRIDRIKTKLKIKAISVTNKPLDADTKNRAIKTNRPAM